MNLIKKSVELRDWQIKRDVRNFVPLKGIEIKWQEVEGQNFATLIGKNKRILQQQASELPILSERVRTLRNLPKMRKINNTVIRIG